MKPVFVALVTLVMVSLSFTASSQATADYNSSAKIAKLATEIKQVLDGYPTALANYKGAAVKDTSETTVGWFRSRKPFTLATKAVIENEDGSYTLYLTFEGFASNSFAMGFATRLKKKLLEQSYAFGKLKEIASGEDGLLEFLPVKAPAKFGGVHMFIHEPDDSGMEDKFGNMRENDVVIRISLPSK
jgi:hypothetical protein